MPRTSDARAKAVRTATRLFSRQGYAGTGLKQIIEESGSPRGSFYFHFPGGKEQLGVEAVQHFGAAVAERLRRVGAGASSASAVVAEFMAGQASALQRSDWEEGCPVAAVTVEAAVSSETLRQAATDTFAAWEDTLAEAFRRWIAEPEARSFARLVVATGEGALLLARAQRSTAPMEETAAWLGQMADWIAQPQGPPGGRQRPRARRDAASERTTS